MTLEQASRRAGYRGDNDVPSRPGTHRQLHPRLTSRAAWEHHDGELPVIEGTLIRLAVDHLPGDRNPKPLWLWSSRPAASPGEADLRWQAFLRRFDIEHTFLLRLFRQVLGWTAPEDPRPPGS